MCVYNKQKAEVQAEQTRERKREEEREREKKRERARINFYNLLVRDCTAINSVLLAHTPSSSSLLVGATAGLQREHA